MTSAAVAPTTYRQLFALAEYRTLFLNRCVVLLSVTASTLALGTITFDATGSAVLTGLSMFGGPLVALVTSHFLLGASDLVRPRTALMCQMGAALLANTIQAVPGMPWQARFVLLAIPYVVNSMFSGTQWVVVRAIVPAESFVLARSTLNLAVGGMQVLGYAVGGLALLWLSPTALFLIAAGADLACLINLRLGLRDRPAKDGTRTGLVRRTGVVNRRLLCSPLTRPLYLAMWIPNGLIVGCEALFIPYGRGSLAGYLFAAGAAGMMTGDLLLGRFVPHHLRDQLIGPLRLLLAVPFCVFWLSPPGPIAVVAVFLASAGYAASLPLQERLIAHTEDQIHGQALGLQGQGMMVWQALGALIGGAIAGYLSPGHSMGTLALGSVLVTVVLTRGLRRSAPSTGR